MRQPYGSTMATSLTALDGTFLELEDADRTAHMHIGGILVFDPPQKHRAPTLDEVREHLDARIDALPRYRQRLSAEKPNVLSWPDWVDDDEFDITRHVRRAALPHPGGWEELLEWAGEFYSRRLDRTRPLWEIVLVENLSAGHWALATKTHHSMVDGVGSVDVAHLLLDVTPDAPHWTVEPPARPTGHLELPALPHWIPAHRFTAAVKGATGAALDAAGAALHPRATAHRIVAAANVALRDELNAAPHTTLNERLGTDRELRALRLSLDEAKAVKNALGGTVNDVVLAGVTGGLRALLQHRGEQLPQQGLRAMVPMNVRAAQEHGAELGNKITSLFVDLPVAEPDPEERYAKIAATTEKLKHSSAPEGAGGIVAGAALAPPVLHALFARSLFGTRLFNLTVTNVPGPQQTLYAFGAPLKTIYPLVPLAAEHAVGIAIASYDGQLCFGINADRDSVPDVDVLAEGIVASLAELQRLARAPR